MKVKFTHHANHQLLSAIDYIKEDNPQAAAHFFTRIKTLLNRLTQYPLSGRKIPEFPDYPQREILIKPYRFIYRVENETILVIGVWHSRQHLSERRVQGKDEEDR
jgi:toxin ParE1/3/4